MRFVMGFVVLISLLLRGYQKSNLFGSAKERVVIAKETKLPLSEFLTYYHSGSFDRMVLEDDNKLL
ncbi:MAG: hypothetical protein GXP45_00420 [bacterium]|nr:hypothetical protein [bacterium]